MRPALPALLLGATCIALSPIFVRLSDVGPTASAFWRVALAAPLLWPLLANLTRLIIAAGGGWLALRWGGDLSQVFIALSVALAAFGLIIAIAVARGAWFAADRPEMARSGNYLHRRFLE